MALHPILQITNKDVREYRDLYGISLFEAKRRLERERVELVLNSIEPAATLTEKLLIDVVRLLNNRRAE